MRRPSPAPPMLLLLSFPLLVSCGPEGPNAPAGAASSPPREVRVTLARLRPMERAIAATGTLGAQERSTLGARVPGPLERLEVDLGSVVREGDLLAQVEPRTYELRLVQAQAALAQARAALGLPPEGDEDRVEIEELSAVRSAQALLVEAEKSRERLLTLTGTGIATQSELDAVQATHTVARTRLDTARDEARTRLAAVAQRRAEIAIAEKQVADTRVIAPFAGVVQERLASAGEYLGVGAPIVTVVRADPLRLRLDVPERDVPLLRAGQTIRLRVEGSDEVHTGVLARLAPALDATSRMLRVEADVPGRTADGSVNLRPGLFARAQIIVDEGEETLCVPEGAITSFAGLEKVITVAEGKALEKTIATGRRSGGWVEVTSGLAAGAPVVLEPGGLRTGTPLRVIEAEVPAPAAARPEASTGARADESGLERGG